MLMSSFGEKIQSKSKTLGIELSEMKGWMEGTKHRGGRKITRGRVGTYKILKGEEALQEEGSSTVSSFTRLMRK